MTRMGRDVVEALSKEAEMDPYNPWGTVRRLHLRALLADHARLRKLIVAADDQAQSFIAGSQDALESDADLAARRAAFEAVQDAHDPGQSWSDFVEEARAIRAEEVS